MRQRLQFSLKWLFTIVTLAGAWGLICRLAFMAVANVPDPYRGPLQMATVAYLALAPAGIALWFFGYRIKVETGAPRFWRRFLLMWGMQSLGALLLASSILTGFIVFQVAKTLIAND